MTIDSPIPWILVAVARERLFFRPKILQTLAPNIRLAELEGHVFVVAETGMGAERVREALVWLADRSTCSRAVFAGFAGGLRADLGVGDLVWADEVVAADGRRHHPSEPPPASARRGILRSCDRLVSSPAEKRRLAADGGDVVDMESAAFAAWCDAHSVRWSCVRAVSDAVDTTVPSELFDLVSDRGVSLARLARAIARRPSLVADLWTLGRSTRLAARNLSAALRLWLGRAS
jgi:nucleoside phosphorylase